MKHISVSVGIVLYAFGAGESRAEQGNGVPLIASADVAQLVPMGFDTLLCGRGTGGKGSPEWHRIEQDDKEAMYVLRARGQLEVDSSARERTIAFKDTKDAFAIAETEPNKGDDAEIVACGKIVAGTVYFLPLDKVKTGRKISIRLFDKVSDGAPYLVQYRRSVLSTAQQSERDAVHAEPALREFDALARVALLTPSDDAIDRVGVAAHKVGARLVEIRDLWNCASADPRGLLGPAICEETFFVSSLVTSINASLQDLSFGAPEGRPMRIAEQKLADAVAALRPAAATTEDLRKRQCKRIDRLRWDFVADERRLTSHASLANVSTVFTGRYEGKVAARTGVSTDSHIGFVVTSIPAGEKTKFVLREGKRVTLEITTILGTFVGAALNAKLPTLNTVRDKSARENLAVKLKSNGVLGTLIDQDGIADLLDAAREASEASLSDKEKALQRVAVPSLLCSNENVVGSSSPGDTLLELDDDMPPSTGLDNQTFVVEKLDPDHETSVALCAGDACSGAEDDKAVKTRVSLTPSRRGNWSLLAEISGGVGCGAGDCGWAVSSAPSFQPVLGIEGPDQIFEMQRRADPKDAISTALLLSIRTSDTTMVALGPTLLVGTSGAAFTQWNLRFGFEITHGLNFTPGPSLRAVEQPQDYDIGDRVSVARSGAGMTPAAPTFRKFYAPVVQFGVGLSFDLNVIGTLAGDVYKSFGGGK